MLHVRQHTPPHAPAPFASRQILYDDDEVHWHQFDSKIIRTFYRLVHHTFPPAIPINPSIFRSPQCALGAALHGQESCQFRGLQLAGRSHVMDTNVLRKMWRMFLSITPMSHAPHLVLCACMCHWFDAYVCLPPTPSSSIATRHAFNFESSRRQR